MDIFVRNIPESATRRHIEDFFRRVFLDCGITVFHAEKLGEKALAIITVLNRAAAQVFLDRYGQLQRPRRGQQQLRLHWGGKNILCSRSTTEPSNFSLQSLVEDARRTEFSTTEAVPAAGHPTSSSFHGVTLQCGHWDYARDGGRVDQLVFVSQFTDNRQGRIVVGSKESIMLLGPEGSDQCRVDFSYHDCNDIVMGTYEEPSITFNLSKAPKCVHSIPAQAATTHKADIPY
jgi:hypothetical protein